MVFEIHAVDCESLLTRGLKLVSSSLQPPTLEINEHTVPQLSCQRVRSKAVEEELSAGGRSHGRAATQSPEVLVQMSFLFQLRPSPVVTNSSTVTFW